MKSTGLLIAAALLAALTGVLYWSNHHKTEDKPASDAPVATKLLSFNAPNTAIGVVTFGQAAIGVRTVSSFLPELEAHLPGHRLSVDEFAKTLSDFFVGQWKSGMPADYKGPNITFVVGGFDDGQPYGKVFAFDIPAFPVPAERNPGDFGLTWGGQKDIVDRLIQGFDNGLIDILKTELSLDADKIAELRPKLQALQLPMPLAFMALQDDVDLALFFVETTIAAQRLTLGLRGCGGPIDVATITRRDGFRFIQQKQVKGRENPSDR